jgi:hypothetical protein
MMHFIAKRFLSAYLDDALDEKRQAAVSEHVNKCSCCKEMYSALKQGSHIIKTVMDQDATSLPLLNREGIKWTRPVVSREWFGWIAAVVLALALSGLLFFQNKITPAIDDEGAFYLDLLLQEAANVGNSPQLLTTPYAALAQSPDELIRLTGVAQAEPALPSGFRFKRGFIYDKSYGGGIGRVYVSDDGRILCLVEQPIETKMAYGAGNSEEQLFLGRECIEVVWPSLRLLSCESGSKRILLLSNVSTTQLESAFLHYPDLQPVH